MKGRIAIMAVLLLAGVACASTSAATAGSHRRDTSWAREASEQRLPTPRVIASSRVSQADSGNTLEAKVELLAQRVAALEARQRSPAYQGGGVSSASDSLERRVSSLENQVGASLLSPSSLEHRVRSLESSVSTLDREVGTSPFNPSSLERRVSSLESSVSRLGRGW